MYKSLFATNRPRVEITSSYPISMKTSTNRIIISLLESVQTVSVDQTYVEVSYFLEDYVMG